ncbi:MAG: hypothetical protein D3926_09385 [Desulfobacteraceae bacterium]|nr:MAG: hypothetical protein D3926_09385 [Desulfobacteraceae bacterium]
MIPMTSMLRLLVVHSFRDLIKYKSFLFLVFVLILLDRGIKRLKPQGFMQLSRSDFSFLSADSAHYLFNELPAELFRHLTDYRAFILIGLIFITKQIISLWPSSDMRRMHRGERGVFGLFASLVTIRGQQVVWDASAILTLGLITLTWTGAAFLVSRLFFALFNAPLTGLLIFSGSVLVMLPILMAGSSFSSKLAVIAAGSFKEKIILFLKLFTSIRMFSYAWLFFTLRLIIETLFVFILPLAILVTMEIFWLRIILATLIATPVYSYLKMISFKFFLQVYSDFPLVRDEYAGYYHQARETGRI